MDVFGANLLERAAAAAASWQELSHSFPHNCAAEIRTRLSIYIAKLYVSQKPDTLERVPQTGKDLLSHHSYDSARVAESDSLSPGTNSFHQLSKDLLSRCSRSPDPDPLLPFA